MNKTALVTGANGDLGSAFVRNLSWNGYEVIALVRDPSKPSSQELMHHPHVTLVQCDVEKQDDVDRCIKSLQEQGVHIGLVAQAAGVFGWDKDLGGAEAAIETLTKANVDTKETVYAAIDKIMHDAQTDMIVIPVCSHAADHPEWMDTEKGYVTAMQKLEQKAEEKRSRYKGMYIIKPGLIDTEKGRKTFTKETIGFDPNWDEAPSPDEYVLGILREYDLVDMPLAA